ncbi:hypothetical protein [Mesorhizobium silamurunense]|uniref:hypothetical protein n=1 Tax=Mesorhizobium silamurunense TaxID=499528 RepID=UPI00177DE9CF|nr:hypothetical protein [Mesorhizobium silamurunense]
MTMKFPFTEDTLGKKLEAGTGMSVYCLTCKRNAVLNVADLALGFDQGDLLPRVPRRRPGRLQPAFHEPCGDAGQAQGLDALSLTRERPGTLAG